MPLGSTYAYSRSEIMFKNYVYIPSASKTRLDNFKQIVEGVTAILPQNKNSLAVDVGSNDGSLLQEFKKSESKL